MTYTPYLIARNRTGLDKSLQPWLNPDDSYVELFDGFVYRGETCKRNGYSGYANGRRSIYCESRMVKRVTAAPMSGAIDGSNRAFSINATAPIRRGTFTVNGSNPVQIMTDDGLGGFTGAGTGTIDYTTGVVQIEFNVAPVIASTVTATYDYHPGNPVMGVMNFYTSTNTRELLVADTQYVNRYNPATDRLEDISPALPYTGNNKNFWSWVNYPTGTGLPRLVFANGTGTSQLQQYNGTTVTDFPYVLTGITQLNAKQIFYNKDRLILFQTWENGTLYPRRIRISGFGSAGSDVFDSTAPGAGVIDIPDNTWFFGAAFNRDDLMIFTEAATWTLKYTGNDVIPFVLDRIDESRGSKAAFSVTTYLNRTIAASPRGLMISDGYRVERADDKLPDFTFNEVDQDNFDLCYSGFVDEDRDVYIIYPTPSQLKSDRILVMNFEEDNYSIYRLPLSCMGTYINSVDVTWNDLAVYANWQQLAAEYGDWNSFSYTQGAVIPIGGGHGGEVWRLNVEELEDNPQRIRGISIIDGSTLRVTTDYNNYQVGDYIYFTGVNGMVEINNKQLFIKNIDVANRVFDLEIQTSALTPYTSGGTAARVIPFTATTKKFNPFSEMDKKVRCGWLYFYVDTSNTALTTADGEPEKCFIDVDVFTNDNEFETTPTFQTRIDCSNINNELGTKKWTKIWINQTARFIQFRMRNVQAGARIKIQAIMPGFMPTGRLVS